MAAAGSLVALAFWVAVALAAGEGNLPPVFTHDMDNLALSENTPVGTVIYTLQGKDPELLPVKYGLVGSDKFSVNADTGDVTLVQPLDRETMDNLKLLVSIEDQVPGGGNNLVQVLVTVIVLDENDNPPTFKNSPYEVDVPEDEAVGSTILQNILVEDRDSVGDNLEVTCVANQQWPEACDMFEVVPLHSSSNQYGGALVLTKPLDYNTKPFYQFQLQATDGTQSALATVEVRVMDVQDSPPVFEGALSAALAEDAPLGTLAAVLRARDADRAHPRPVHYQLLTNPLDFFLLDSTTGELKTAKPLDREALDDPSSPLNLTVRATEIVDGQPLVSNLTSTVATFTVTIKDVNDEPPRFNRKEYRVEVPESLPVGTPLPNLDMIVTDKDLGLNSVFSLRVSDGVGAFVVEPAQAAGSASVTLRLNASLDYEDPNQRKFILEVIAEEVHTQPRLQSRAHVTVVVLDVNDNAPVFPAPVYVATVAENARAGTVVTAVTATDRDTGRFGTEGILYQLSGNGAELFSVDNRTGVITVAECATPGVAPCLDIETRKDYFLHFKATDEDGAGQTSAVSLQISLQDANDNAPVFLASLYRAGLDEDAAKFEPDLQVQARDADQSSEIRYSIVSPAETPFWIDAVTGRLGVATPASLLHRDQDLFTLIVQATDGVHNATCTVEVTIRDVNNHAPVFESPLYEATVAEDAPIGTSVATVTASDLDSGVNAEIRYSIQRGALDAFTVHNLSGVVSVTSILDYDKRNTYRIQVVASDLGMPSLTGTTEVVVQVINVNDKKPYFTPVTQRAEVSADAEIGTAVHTLAALDPDITDNSQLLYQLNTEKPVQAVDNNGNEVTEEGIFSEWFSVLTNGSVIVSRRLQRGRAAVLTLPVTVRDVSAPALQVAEGELIIRLVDVNRHAPVFPQSQYSELLPEEQPVGTVLATYLATDRETPIAYTLIHPPSPYFHIDNHTGVVRSSQRIDYERVRRIELTLVAVDAGVPPRTGSATVAVDVLNLNDEEPVFAESEYLASVPENAKEGTHVLTLNATDADSGEFGTVRYKLSGEHAALFRVDATSGAVTVARGASLDREREPQLRLQAGATDAAHLTTVPILITVLDENDNPPVFSQKVYKGTIAENLQLQPPAAILQIRAEDRDIGINAQIQYKIVNQSEPDTFTVDELTGIIYPLRAVVGDTTYRLTVEATDTQHTDTAHVDIHVLTVNKHSPSFVLPAPEQHLIQIPENAAQADFLVMTVNATDEDVGENGRVSYFFKVDNHNVAETAHFSIHPHTGELRTKTFLDREDSPAYQLVLVATDNAVAPFETLHFLTVLLQDSNDNVPHFDKQEYTFSISENQPVGIIIGVLKAMDKDTGENGRIYYHIVEGNQDGAFTLDRTQGFLRSNISFDRETRSEYWLTVYVSNEPVPEPAAVTRALGGEDNSTRTLAPAIARLTITVLDENDNEPIFEELIYYAGVKHTAKPGAAVAQMAARDDDSAENGTLAYLVAASNLYKFGAQRSSGSIVPSPFNVTNEGVVVTASYMSEYNQDRFVLDIIAQEVAPPHRRATAQLYIWIIEKSQSIRAVVSRPCSRAAGARRGVAGRLSEASGARVVLAAVRGHVRADTLYSDWCEMQLLAVDRATDQVLPVDKVLETIDSKYDELKDMYQNYGIETVVAASTSDKAPEGFDPALAALIALLIVLFTGIVTFIVVCSCLKHWVMSPPSLDTSKGDSLARRRILEELSTTENPLWLETKLRPYEEQELTMNVFGDQLEQANADQPTSDNTYATIQTNRGEQTAPAAEYATLAREHAPLEAAFGFQGSTFKPPSPTPEPPPRPSAGLAHLPWSV